MRSIKDRLRERNKPNSESNVQFGVDPTETPPQYLRLRRNPSLLSDPRNWPELRTDRAALEAVVDDPAHFTPQQRALAWHIFVSGPRYAPYLKHQASGSAKHELKARARSVEVYQQLTADPRTTDWNTDAADPQVRPTGKTKDGRWTTALREYMSANGVRVILEYPELTSKALRSRIYRFVLDDLRVSVLEYDPTMEMAERKQVKRIRARRVVEERWARKWDEKAQEWKPYMVTVYALVEVPERDLASSTVVEEQPETAHPLDSQGDPLWGDRPHLPSLAEQRDDERHEARETARALLQAIQPVATLRQLRAAQRRADGEQLTANERQALCELRRKLQPMNDEICRQLGWRNAKNRR